MNINGIDYTLGAEHAGLACWLDEHRVGAHEFKVYEQAAGDFAQNELERYLADPDSYSTTSAMIKGWLITDAQDPRKRWPLRSAYKNDKGAGSRMPRGPAVAGTQLTDTPAPPVASAPAPVDAGWPRYEIKGDWQVCRTNSETGGGELFTKHRSVLPQGGRYQDDVSVKAGWKPITPAEAATWLRANGHAQAANEIEALDDFEPVGTMPVVGDRVVGHGDKYSVVTIDPNAEFNVRLNSDGGAQSRYFETTGRGNWRILRRQPAKLRDGKGR